MKTYKSSRVLIILIAVILGLALSIAGILMISYSHEEISYETFNESIIGVFALLIIAVFLLGVYAVNEYKLIDHG